jgi:hypothetical protein
MTRLSPVFHSHIWSDWLFSSLVSVLSLWSHTVRSSLCLAICSTSGSFRDSLTKVQSLAPSTSFSTLPLYLLSLGVIGFILKLMLITRGADSDSQVGEIIMASAASLNNFFARRGDNPPRNSKTNNAGLKVGDRSPSSPPVSAPMLITLRFTAPADLLTFQPLLTACPGIATMSLPG